MKMYMIDTKYDLGKIIEAEVVKETEKTYTIKRENWGKYCVRKSEMRVWNYLICKTYDEALENLKKILEQNIEQSEARINKLNADIKKYNIMLADIENGEFGK